MKSGILAAESVYSAITALPEGEEHDLNTSPVDISAYQTGFDNSWIAEELKEVRNIRPSFHNKLGNWGGILYSGIDSLILKGRVPWTFHHPKEDWASTRPARLVNVSVSSTNFCTLEKLTLLPLSILVNSNQSITQLQMESYPSTS